MISYSVGQRMKEYGIRLAFGAGRARVFRLVLSRGLGLTASGLALGVPAALGVRDYVEPFLVGVEPTDPVTLAAIVGLVAVVSLTAVKGPALRATLVDPVESLRSD